MIVKSECYAILNDKDDRCFVVTRNVSPCGFCESHQYLYNI